MKQQVKQLSKADYKKLKTLTYITKNLTNEVIYNVRQYYFKEIFELSKQLSSTKN